MCVLVSLENPEMSNNQFNDYEDFKYKVDKIQPSVLENFQKISDHRKLS